MDDTCTGPIANATLAADTMNSGAELIGAFINPPEQPSDEYVLDPVFDCDGEWSLDVTNNSSTSVRYVGAYGWIGSDDMWMSMHPTVGIHVPPDETVRETAPFGSTTSEQGCNANVWPIISTSPMEPFDYPPASADDPQASDDPAVWFPALQEHINIGREKASADYLIDHAYDPRSPELPIATGPQSERPGPSSLKYCSVIDVDLPADFEGEWAVLLLTGSPSEYRENGPVMGLFARGSDRVWRALATDIATPWTYDTDDPCAAPTID